MVNQFFRAVQDGLLWRRIDAGAQAASRAALFLDRDGVVIEDRHYLSDPAKVAPIPGIPGLIRAARRRGMAVVIVTNQAGIGRGYFGWGAYAAVERAVIAAMAAENVAPDATYACPFHPEAGLPPYKVDHPWRKPGPGMLAAAGADLNLALARSIIVGDKASDMAAGAAAGLPLGLLMGAEREHRDLPTGTMQVIPVADGPAALAAFEALYPHTAGCAATGR